jgi:hypothetical protein
VASDLKSQITLEASHKKELDGKITSANTSISQVASDLKAQIKLEASHNTDQGKKIAAIEVTANNNTSAIKLKADTTTVDSKVTKINGRLDSAEANIKTLKADVAKVDDLIAEKIKAITFESLIAKATIIKATVAISSGVSISAPIISASTSMTVGKKAVATKEYVDGKVDDMATQTWVNGKGFMTSLPSTISVDKVKADSIAVGVYTVATQYWCHTTKKFATQDWVNEQLKNYSKTNHTHSGYAASDHTHKWSKITDKPDSFKPTKHRHSISLSIANGHTHKYTNKDGKSVNTTGVSTNATHSVSTNTGYYPS